VAAGGLLGQVDHHGGDVVTVAALRVDTVHIGAIYTGAVYIGTARKLCRSRRSGLRAILAKSTVLYRSQPRAWHTLALMVLARMTAAARRPRSSITNASLPNGRV